MKKLIRKIALWLEWRGRQLREKYDLCDICHDDLAEQECPCGKRVCDECRDFYMYTDEVCCMNCSKEIHDDWDKCKKHEFDQPYENEDGMTVHECKLCGFPAFAD